MTAATTMHTNTVANCLDNPLRAFFGTQSSFQRATARAAHDWWTTICAARFTPICVTPSATHLRLIKFEALLWQFDDGCLLITRCFRSD
jgi:hypothetical protein